MGLSSYLSIDPILASVSSMLLYWIYKKREDEFEKEKLVIERNVSSIGNRLIFVTLETQIDFDF